MGRPNNFHKEIFFNYTKGQHDDFGNEAFVDKQLTAPGSVLLLSNRLTSFWGLGKEKDFACVAFLFFSFLFFSFLFFSCRCNVLERYLNCHPSARQTYT